MAAFTTLTPTLSERLSALLPPDTLFSDVPTLEKYSRDQSKNTSFFAEAVVKPRTVEEVARILAFCNSERLPIVVQGGLSGLNAAALPVHQGIAMSMERLNAILKIDKENFQVTTEAGVVTEHLQNVLEAEGLFYPPDPQGRGWSHIGGNVSTNAGGPKCVKYGVTRDYVLNLEIVLPSGEILWTGANTLKNSTAYNLTQLIIGSEGTLAVVTKVVLKVLSLPSCRLLLRAPFARAADACAAVAAIFQAGITPSALEFMSRTATDFVTRYLGLEPLLPEYEAFLLIETDGNDMEVLHRDCMAIAAVLERFNVGEVLFADSHAQQQALWHLRRNAGNAMIQLTRDRLGEDTVVPRASLPQQLAGAESIAREYQVKLSALGHLGDGNMHLYLVNETEDQATWLPRALAAKRAIFALTKSLGGMLSAEHGVGLLQKPFLDIFLSNTHIGLLRGIKKVFDPNGILNPGKIFD